MDIFGEIREKSVIWTIQDPPNLVYSVNFTYPADPPIHPSPPPVCENVPVGQRYNHPY